MATLKPNILFIGYGHLAKSLLSNSLRKNYNINYINSKNKVLSINSKKKNNLKNIFYKYIFLLVKPDVFLKKGHFFKDFISPQSKIISCMAGIKLLTISNNLNNKNVIRIMPNVMAKQKISQTFVFAKNKKILDNDFKKLIRSFGTVYFASNEDQINIATSIFGSGPAFIAYLIKSYLDAAKNLSKKNKIKDIDLMRLFQNVLLTNKNSKDLELFLNSIASKKGTTQAGVNFLKSQNIKKAIYTTFDRAYKRAREIGVEK